MRTLPRESLESFDETREAVEGGHLAHEGARRKIFEAGEIEPKVQRGGARTELVGEIQGHSRREPAHQRFEVFCGPQWIWLWTGTGAAEVGQHQDSQGSFSSLGRSVSVRRHHGTKLAYFGGLMKCGITCCKGY